MKQISYAFLSIILMVGCISQKEISGTHSLIKTYAENDFFQDHFSGIVVKDLKSGDVLLSANGNKLFTPASNTKLVTFYVADHIIHDSLPSLKYCSWNDSLYFSGMGDPTFLHPDFDKQPAFDKLNANKGQLVFVPAVFTGERYGPGWAWDDFPYYFQPEISPLPVYGNCLWIKKESLGKLKIFPKLFDVKINIDTSFIKLKTGRNELENLFEVSYYQLPEKVNQSVPFMVNDSLVKSLLRDTLYTTIATKQFPEFCHTLLLKSQPKDSVFKKMLEESDNFIAEQFLLSASAILCDTLSTQKAIDYAFDNYFSNWKDKVSWRDGSGLSRYNMFSPEFFIELLQKIYAENSWERIKLLLPAGGKEGTMKNFLKASTPFVYAKSGSMTGVYNLSGYLVTDKGNILAFSIMNNNFNISLRDVKTKVEAFLWLLKEKY